MFLGPSAVWENPKGIFPRLLQLKQEIEIYHHVFFLQGSPGASCQSLTLTMYQVLTLYEMVQIWIRIIWGTSLWLWQKRVRFWTSEYMTETVFDGVQIVIQTEKPLEPRVHWTVKPPCNLPSFIVPVLHAACSGSGFATSWSLSELLSLRNSGPTHPLFVRVNFGNHEMSLFLKWKILPPPNPFRTPVAAIDVI